MMPALNYQDLDLQRAVADELPGLTVLQFGTNWCGHCQAAQAVVDPVMAQFPHVARHMVEDGLGRPLGRSYRIKLWPTLVFLQDGKEVDRLVRPQEQAPVQEILARLSR